eukprot:NODE_62_length_25126_cov_0.447277.p13 type:complete len:108 gc:universal NODE_62_length_25126_cov_0.447277:11348-11025(-)
MDKLELKKEVAQKQQLLQQKLDLKNKMRLEKEEKELAKILKGKLEPKSLFKLGDRRNEFSKWDENGMPTHDNNGDELSASKLKKLKKEYDGQSKLHTKYLEHLAKNK